MINKQNLWFLTLFCLILVLSVYYVTMPSELLMTVKPSDEPIVTVTESEILTALRVESDTQIEEELGELKVILTNSDATVDDKNEAFGKIKKINENRGMEETLETLIKDSMKLNVFIKITGDQIRVVVDSKEHDLKLANDIMRLIQEKFEEKKYISVKFQS